MNVITNNGKKTFNDRISDFLLHPGFFGIFHCAVIKMGEKAEKWDRTDSRNFRKIPIRDVKNK